MSDLNLTNKITILAFLSKGETYISNSTLTEFFLEHYLTDYFSLQTAINDLIDAEMVDVGGSYGRTTYKINLLGKETLEAYAEKLSPDILKDIGEYYKNNAKDLSVNSIITADYEKLPQGNYLCHLAILENDQKIIDMELHAYTEEQAQTICINWKARHENVYDMLMDILVS